MCTVPHAVATTAELYRSGMTRRMLRFNLDVGTLLRARRGVYVASGACESLAAAAAHGGHATCVTAARHLGLWVLSTDERAHVWMCDGERSYHHGETCQCVVHWGEGMADAPAALPPVARILRHLFDCQGVETFFAALESALHADMLDAAALRWLRLHSHARMREALALARSDADSGLESLLRWRLRHYALTVRTQVHVIGVGWVDVLIDDRLIVETDGRENHDGPSQRHKDLVRDANAAMWGYTSLRFDYAMVVHDWELVENAILGALGLLRTAR